MEETALEKAVAPLTILSKNKWQSGRSRGGGQPSVSQSKKPRCERHEKFGEDALALQQPQDLGLGRKQVGRSMAVAATADGKFGCLALLKGRSEGKSYLVDTGLPYSILPFSSAAQPTGPALTAASGASIKACCCPLAAVLSAGSFSNGGATCGQPHSSSQRSGGSPLTTFTSHSGGTSLFA